MQNDRIDSCEEIYHNRGSHYSRHYPRQASKAKPILLVTISCSFERGDPKFEKIEAAP